MMIALESATIATNLKELRLAESGHKTRTGE